MRGKEIVDKCVPISLSDLVGSRSPATRNVAEVFRLASRINAHVMLENITPRSEWDLIVFKIRSSRGKVWGLNDWRYGSESSNRR